MCDGVRFLTIVGTYAGYCQICNEPRVVGQIAVLGWPYQGAVCSRCLTQLADEVQRRGSAVTVGVAGNGTGLHAAVSGNGHSR